MAGLSAHDMEQVGHAPLFADLAAADLALLLEGAHAVSYPEPELLFSEGDTADRFFLVLEGRVNLFALTESGDQSVIEVFDPVCSFAEAAIFSSGKFPLNCEAVGGSRLVHIPAASFTRRLRDHHGLILKLLSGLALWQVRLFREISELKSKSPSQRLASFLLALARNARSGPADQTHVRLPVTKTVLASRIGIAPESLSRALARLKSSGVETHGREVVITDLAALRALVGEGAAE